MAAWCTDTSGNFKQWLPIAGGSPFAPWAVIGVGDFNGDGIADLLIQNGGFTAAWCTDASGNFKQWVTMQRRREPFLRGALFA